MWNEEQSKMLFGCLAIMAGFAIIGGVATVIFIVRLFT